MYLKQFQKLEKISKGKQFDRTCAIIIENSENLLFDNTYEDKTRPSFVTIDVLRTRYYNLYFGEEVVVKESKGPNLIHEFTVMDALRLVENSTFIEPLYFMKENGSEYLFMKNIHGQNLNEWIDNNIDKITFYKIRSIIRNIFDSIHEAWSILRFNHCDLHTKNIMISDEEEIYIIDYEFSRFIKDDVFYGYVERTIGMKGMNDLWFFDVCKLLISIKNQLMFKENICYILDDKINQENYNQYKHILCENIIVDNEQPDKSDIIEFYYNKYQENKKEINLILKYVNKLLSYMIRPNKIRSFYFDDLYGNESLILNRDITFDKFINII